MRIYRGKSKEGNKSRGIMKNRWVYGWLEVWADGAYFINKEGMGIEVIPETVGQSTGLKDKHGTEIFEGDILSWVSCYTREWLESYTKVIQAIVIWWEQDGRWGLQNREEIFIPMESMTGSNEIIGNITDNLELYKQVMEGGE